MHDGRRNPVTIEHLIVWGRAQSGMPRALRNMPAKDIWMDSRKIRPGDIFLAVRGEKDDGHSYVGAALNAGAAAAIVCSSSINDFPADLRSRLIVVRNPLEAAGRMAEAYRRMLNIPFVAITGSNGKTTTRQFISAVLESKFKVGQTGGNWNNHLGVPLTILRFSGDERIGVIEMGSNHSGEIAPLSKIVSPDIAVITNVGYAHIGNFGNLEKTADEKFDITAGMRNKDAFCVLNGDDSRLVKRAVESEIKSIFFGSSRRSSVRPGRVKIHEDGRTTFSVDNLNCVLNMAGRHFVNNALPAIYLGRWFGISDTQIVKALAELKPDSMRGGILRKKGVSFIVDCYNANPSSMQSAIMLLKDTPASGRRVAITGDMLELGKFSNILHRQLGRRLGAAKIDELITVGEYSRLVAENAVASGMKKIHVHCASDAEEGLKLVRKVLKKGDTVLLKASRSVKLETISKGY
jgi:UDP-N-acetylmuramoyl-tripeptide--D-alanyl-D-alanine ligase